MSGLIAPYLGNSSATPNVWDGMDATSSSVTGKAVRMLLKTALLSVTGNGTVWPLALKSLGLAQPKKETTALLYS